MEDPAIQDGIQRALEVLRSLPDPPRIETGLESDPERLADLFLDHHESLDGLTILEVMTRLMCPMFDRIVHDLCVRECRFLDPGLVAEDAVAMTYEQLQNGGRVRPFTAWAWKTAAAAVRLAADDPKRQLFREEMVARGSIAGRAMVELGRMCNLLPFEQRRVGWLLWLERMDPRQIAEVTGLPLERIEHLVSDMVDRALATVAEKLGHAEALAAARSGEVVPGSDEFWSMMEGEGDAGEDEEGREGEA